MSVALISIDFINCPINACVVDGVLGRFERLFRSVFMFDIQRRFVDDGFFLDGFVGIDRWNTTAMENIS